MLAATLVNCISGHALNLQTLRIISGVQLKIIFPAPDLLSNLNLFSNFECEKLT